MPQRKNQLPRPQDLPRGGGGNHNNDENSARTDKNRQSQRRQSRSSSGDHYPTRQSLHQHRSSTSHHHSSRPPAPCRHHRLTVNRQFPLVSSSDHTFVISRRGRSSSSSLLGGGPKTTTTTTTTTPLPPNAAASHRGMSLSFVGIDEPLSWESVRWVRCYYHLACDDRHKSKNSIEECYDMDDMMPPSTYSCPICLDNVLCCPRITKCGHVFCLPCLIRHLHTTTATATTTHDNVQKQRQQQHPKCPCCAVPVHLDDVRPCTLVGRTRVRAPTDTLLGGRQNLPTMKFVKLHRSKNCGAPYLPRCSPPPYLGWKRSHPSALPDQNDADAPYSRFTYGDGDQMMMDLRRHLADLQDRLSSLTVTTSSSFSSPFDAYERMAVEWSIQFVEEREVTKVRNERYEEEEVRNDFANNLGWAMRQPLPSGLFWTSSHSGGLLSTSSRPDEGPPPCHVMDHPSANALNATKSSQRLRGDSVASGGASSSSSSVGRAAAQGEERARSSSTRPTVKREQPQHEQREEGGTMYLDPSGDEYLFYQAEDGRLCFLSPYNLKCLQHEFSTHPPPAVVPAPATATPSSPDDCDIHHPQEPHHHLHHQAEGRGSVWSCPLPDFVEGAIVDVEHVQLTPEVRQRLRFLSHLPLFVEIYLVEIKLGRMLSRTTKKHFAKEFYARQNRRAALALSEQRERDRDRRLEQERIDALKSRYRSVDPNDPFFHSPPVFDSTEAAAHAELDTTTDDFGPRLAVEDETGGTTAATRRGAPPSPSFPAESENPAPTVSFSQIVRSGGGGRGRGVGDDGSDRSAGLLLDDFPALGSPSLLSSLPLPPPPPPPRVWGDRSKLKELTVHNVTTTSSSPAEVAEGSPIRSSPDPIVEYPSSSSSSAGGRRSDTKTTKKGGQKIVLFSTGGLRGIP